MSIGLFLSLLLVGMPDLTTRIEGGRTSGLSQLRNAVHATMRADPQAP